MIAELLVPFQYEYMAKAMWTSALVGGTCAFLSVFLMLKGYEYYADYEEHMMPFLARRPYALAEQPATRLFVNLYYVATALHALHLFTGIAILLGNTDEESVFTQDGKEQLQRRLAAAINATLKQKEGFGGIGNVYFTNFVVQ